MSEIVGRSWRTYAKHEIMNSFIGQEAAASRTARINARRRIWIDLTAGDAAKVDDTDWAHGCSSGLLAFHAAQSAQVETVRRPFLIELYEIQSSTYDRLQDNLAEHLPDLGYTRHAKAEWRLGDRVRVRTFNASGRNADISFLTPRDAVLVLNDANAITEWAMRPTFTQEICAKVDWLFRSLSVLGCNPAGLKRLDLKERLGWFDLVQAQQCVLPDHRDLLLAAIERDAAQWAYLLQTAVKWREKTQSVVRSAFRKCTDDKDRVRTAAMSWWKTEPDRFEETKRELFLTKAERLEVTA